MGSEAAWAYRDVFLEIGGKPYGFFPVAIAGDCALDVAHERLIAHIETHNPELKGGFRCKVFEGNSYTPLISEEILYVDTVGVREGPRPRYQSQPRPRRLETPAVLPL